jgi:hypothetical protein
MEPRPDFAARSLYEIPGRDKKSEVTFLNKHHKHRISMRTLLAGGNTVRKLIRLLA